ncbi:hypothetical protein D1AOALGA4SA_5466 [Olavius algarvensis Delta 1 endosymbiont]|nr:hypothetical protein D1AOALGA4SA_5466 [Olavius algarvensis Delta 1 endosymbiont]
MMRVIGFQVSAQPPAKNGWPNRKIIFWSAISNSAFVGFRISKYYRHHVGWIECNEIQQSLDLAQPNLLNAKSSEITRICANELSHERWLWLKKSQSDQ